MRMNPKPSLLVCSAALLLSIHPAPAQQTNSHTEKLSSAQHDTPSAEAKKPSAGPFHGKLAAIDKVAKTIKVGKRTFYITAETKIQKAGKPARLEDGVVGEPCSGYVKPDDHGRLMAKSVTFGPKSELSGSDKNAGETKGTNKKAPST